MGELIAPVKKGEVEQFTSDAAKKRSVKGSSDLGKQEFLNLLVAQMQYQDPLNPSSDTEFISQLASFSSLEQMQNLNATIANSQAFGLVGSTVSVGTEGDETKEGIVDYVTMSNGKTYLSIEGELYDASKLKGTISPYYIAKQKGPTVAKTDAKYDHDSPKDVKLKVDMGTEEGTAGSFVVYMGDGPVDVKNMIWDPKTGTLTIKKEAFAGLDPGKHPIILAFDDVNGTVISDKVSVEVTGTKPPVDEGKKSPAVEKTEAKFNRDKPEDIKVKMSLGEKEGLAENFVVFMGGAVVDAAYLAFDSETGTLTIKQEALAKLPLGKHPVIISFDDADSTVAADKVTVEVTQDKKPEEEKKD